VVVSEEITVSPVVTTASALRWVLSGLRVVGVSANAEVTVDLYFVGLNGFDVDVVRCLGTVDCAAAVVVATQLGLAVIRPLSVAGYDAAVWVCVGLVVSGTLPLSPEVTLPTTN